MRYSSLAAAAASLVLASACGSDSSSGPKIGPPASVSVTTAPTAAAAAGGSAGTFAVKVSDAGGQGVAGVAVTFASVPAGAATFAPATATTDAAGIAATAVTLGTVAGSANVSATATGVTAKATASIVTTAGAAAKLVNNPKTLRLVAVGDTARITAALQDQYANPVSGAVAYVATDPTLVSVNGSGLVTALRVGGVTNVIATASGRSDTTEVTVQAAGAACAGTTPVALAVGQLMTLTTSSICLGGSAATTEFAVIAYNSSTDANNLINASATALGAGAAPTTVRAPTAGPLAVRSPTGAGASRALEPDLRFHERMLAGSRSLRRMFGAARTTHEARLQSSRRTTGSGRLAPSASYSSIPITAKVGDFITLNTNAQNACNGPTNTVFRIAAVGTQSLVLADTANPANGFTDADYTRFAARFDTLVYPLDVGAFGAPSDMDENGRVAILFTKEVNKLTGINSNSYVGGYFYPRDLFPKVAGNGLEACAASNEGEMFYMLVPDPAGTINGNKRSVGFVDSLTTGVIAHEFQHLINAGRRLYVNSGAQDFEDTWLNEGLSHIAEELLYFRESGMQPRMRLTDADIRVNSKATYPYWKTDAASNFRRFIEFLDDPGLSSPVTDNDELSTRGATWSFLRFAVDRTFASDAGVWQRFGNSTVTGRQSLKYALQTDAAPLLADFAVANYVGDLGVNSDVRYIHKSWNYRDIYSNTFINLGYPLKTTGLTDGVASAMSIRGSSASYLRMSVAASKEALLTFTTGQGAPNTALEFTVIRTK